MNLMSRCMYVQDELRSVNQQLADEVQALSNDKDALRTKLQQVER